MSMKKIINEVSMEQPKKERNYLAKKFGAEIESFSHIPPANADLYVSCEMESEILEKLKDFFEFKRILFLLGNSGCGKSTILRHYLNNDEQFNEPYILDGNCKYALTSVKTLIIPIDYSRQLGAHDDFDVKELISKQIRHSLNLVSPNYQETIRKESLSIANFFGAATEVSPQDLLNSDDSIDNLKIKKLTEYFAVNQFESAILLLQYFLKNHNETNDIKRVAFVADDLEVVQEQKIKSIYEHYLIIVEEMEKFDNGNFVAKALFGMRPYSYRYLKEKCGDNGQFTTHHNYFEESGNYLEKKALPNLKLIINNNINFIKKNTVGKSDKWRTDLNKLTDIINRFSNEMIGCISNLCHNNIADSCNIIGDVLKNRIWCQYEFNDRYVAGAFEINVDDFKFDKQSIIRTLGCGEMAYYSSSIVREEEQTEEPPRWYYPRSYDGTCTIPNILRTANSKELDVFPALVMTYMKGQYAMPISDNGESITKEKLCNIILQSFYNVNIRKVAETIDYLYSLKILRKCWNTGDSLSSRDKLNDYDLVYLSSKGRALLELFNLNSTLIEMYREDLEREYNDETGQASYYLILNKKHDILYADLIELLSSAYKSEDSYYGRGKKIFGMKNFELVINMIQGVERSLDASEKVKNKNKLKRDIEQLKKAIQRRLDELKENK